MKNMTLQQLSLGMEVCPLAKDRAISKRVMRGTGRAMTDYNPMFERLFEGDDDDSPFQFGRKLKQQRGRDMAIWI